MPERLPEQHDPAADPEFPRITAYDPSADPEWPEGWSAEPTERDLAAMSAPAAEPEQEEQP
jgi:hypothetical protein